MQNISVRFAKHGGELKPLTVQDGAKYFEFRKELAEGEEIELFITKIENENDATAGQIAKIHAMIRDLARETGNTFDEMKVTVKEKAGLINPASKECVSFAKCNKKELSDAIQTCIEIGNFIGYYF